MYMFHKDIKPEEKEKLEKIIDFLKKVMVQQGYKTERFIQKKRSISIGGEVINKTRLYFKRDNTDYAISIQIYSKV